MRSFLHIALCLALLIVPWGVVAADEQPEPLWDVAIGSKVLSTAVSPNGAYVAVGTGSNGAMRLFDGEGAQVWEVPTGSPVFQVSISEDGRYVAGASDKVRVVDQNGKVATQIEDNGFFAYSTAISPDGKHVAAGFDNHVFGVYSANGFAEWMGTLGDDAASLALSRDGRYLVAGSKDDNVSYFADHGTLVWSYETGETVGNVALSPDGGYVAAGSMDRTVYFFDRDGTLLWKYTADDRIFGVAVAEDGERVAVASGHTVTLLDQNGEELWGYDAGTTVFCLSMTPDAGMIVYGTGGSGNRLVVLEGEKVGDTGEAQDPMPTPVFSYTRGEENGIEYLADSFALKEDPAPEIAGTSDGAAVTEISRRTADADSAVMVRMTVDASWVAAHGGTGQVKIATCLPDEDGILTTDAEVIPTRFIGYDPENRLIFEGKSPYPLTAYGVVAVTGDTAPMGAFPAIPSLPDPPEA
ncbi:outer membrane protein assembly factor BamB [Methanofollis sp. W23]|uniref:WD40 repeat domain-containing protein n=1 Tax=Methanofollis sp. W23 TaxID=2817849 RepID=UPI001AE986A6|nr:PQQ-binding-like beta-propeller repeat protein [Methanofollis sp. W23]MBP2144918.1 outer membrane protein assembly factor BamB [Methanofollis sp. W23]